MAHYPAFLDLVELRCVVVGGGLVAESKVRDLLRAGAEVTVVSPALTAPLMALAESGMVAHVPRPFREGDLADAVLAIGATNDRAVNEKVHREAAERGILVNVVDDATRSTFITPSVVRRGDLTVAVSTTGKAPALAVRVRERIGQVIGEEYEQFVEIAGGLRARVAEAHPDSRTRKELWYRLVDSDVLELLKRGESDAAAARAAEIMGVPGEHDAGADDGR